MKEFIDKLISELKEEHERCINRYGVVGGNLPASIVKRCMNIVNELAEEYKVSEIPTGSECKTNADIIRSMTDEELAEYISELIRNSHEYMTGEGDWLIWLQSEAE